MSRVASSTECFKQGVEARDHGRKLADNPYDLRTPEHKDWAAGWSATFDLDEDSDPASDRDQPADEAGLRDDD
jgi:hypothetical protein